ncbi:putative methyltransferase-domain-containing protein [Stachybotrys elegans]|uniref:25S rRNA adenine-N(1) methyltransferase n=1 Tax=Stachybotrys elegans TaxID=80388 RepID=A0A8K0SLQ1_9HYPO|nr:putative methyltransferase-domain-containing protein [Stachybotrys elegans]
MSRKASRSLINKHHQLEKKRQQAVAKGDKESESSISAELGKLGGLAHYQQASLQGQIDELKASGERLRMLEVGALSTRNACSVSGLFDMVHIDLNSQEPGIQKQDFMERPLPTDEADKFDMISLSLVLNFVPDATGRGDMLRRTLAFLRLQISNSATSSEPFLPSLFLVLPRSCVDNSRYLTDSSLQELMRMLGYVRVRDKVTQKLTYGLWKREKTLTTTNLTFPKKEVNPGRTRNNFAIILKS